MTLFKYNAYGSSGDLVEGEVNAIDNVEAEEILFKRGLTPFYIKSLETNGFKSFSFFGKKNLNQSQVASFTREFATLEQANIPLDSSLRILATQSSIEAQRIVANELLKHVIDGMSLSDAMSRLDEIFSKEYINVIREGEAVGKVGAALDNLANMLERRQELKSRIQSALIYPSLLITLALVSISVVLGTLVPSVAPIFADNNKSMPSGLQFILDIQDNLGIIFVGFVSIGLVIYIFFRMSASRPLWKVATGKFYLRIPIIGPLLAQITVARFALTLGSMLKAGVPLLQGLESARTAVSNDFFNYELQDVIEQVRGGSSLSGAISRIPYFPVVAVQMMTIGEETAQLDDMLIRISNMFEKQTQRSIERAMGLLTPTLTITIAAVVGGLIMTVMDAVLSINDLASQ